MFIIFKLINRRWWVRLDPEMSVLVAALDRLRWLKKDERTDDIQPSSLELVDRAVLGREVSQPS
jgi:hypothetical protein